MEDEEDPELDISQMLPEPSGFMAFAGNGNRLVLIYISPQRLVK